MSNEDNIRVWVSSDSINEIANIVAATGDRSTSRKTSISILENYNNMCATLEMNQVKAAVTAIRKRFALSNVYGDPALLKEVQLSGNKIDLLKQEFVKQSGAPLLDIYKALESDTALRISDDFVLTIAGFDPHRSLTKHFAYCFNMQEQDLSSCTCYFDSKFCYQPCKIAYFDSEDAVCAFLQRFPAANSDFPVNTKIALRTPDELIPRFDELFVISEPQGSRRSFRMQHFGKISEIIAENGVWYVRTRGGFVPEGASPVNDESVARKMLAALFEECKTELRRERKNQERKVARKEKATIERGVATAKRVERARQFRRPAERWPRRK